MGHLRGLTLYHAVRLTQMAHDQQLCLSVVWWLNSGSKSQGFNGLVCCGKSTPETMVFTIKKKKKYRGFRLKFSRHPILWFLYTHVYIYIYNYTQFCLGLLTTWLTIIHFWLVVWIIFYFSNILGISSSQLTFIFVRGVGSTTNQIIH